MKLIKGDNMQDRYFRNGTVMMDGGDGNDWSAAHIAGLMMHLVLLALFVWAVIMIIKYTVKYLNAKSGAELSSAEDIAKRRFASGEITKAEYEQLKKDLK
jgi:uncharacterized membrane protein